MNVGYARVYPHPCLEQGGNRPMGTLAERDAEVLAALKELCECEERGARVRDIADKVGCSRARVRGALERLARRGEADRRGFFTWTTNAIAEAEFDAWFRERFR